MAIAEGKIFNISDQSHIKAEFLETIPYDGLMQKVTYATEEFSAVCPFSGLPDIGDLEITYIPNDKIVELKSLKYYIISFRDVGIYQEAATNRIYKDLYKVLEPHYLQIKTVYKVRGGILATCVMDSDEILKAENK